MSGPNGERVSGATVLFEIMASSGQFLDLGNLAPLNGARPAAGGVESGPVSAVTDGDGVARARYWAPFRTDQENDTTVTIPGGSRDQRPRGRLRAGRHLPSGGESAVVPRLEPLRLHRLRARRRTSRSATEIGEGIAFTATQQTGDSEAGNPACLGNEIARYEWNIESTTLQAGRGLVHAFSDAGDFRTVTLVVTTRGDLGTARGR